MKRVLFVLVVCSPVVMALLLYGFVQRGRASQELKMQQRREEIVRDVDPLGETGVYDGKLLEMLLDDPVGTQISSVMIISADLSHPAFQRLGEFGELKSLGFYSCVKFEHVVPVLTQLDQVESVYIETTGFPNQTMNALAGIPSLKSLHFEQIVPAEIVDTFEELRPDVDLKYDR